MFENVFFKIVMYQIFSVFVDDDGTLVKGYNLFIFSDIEEWKRKQEIET